MGLLRWLFHRTDHEERFNTRDGWGITKNFYSIVGLIAAEGARVEFLLGALCSLMTCPTDPIPSQALVANLGFRSRMDVISALVSLSEEQRFSKEVSAVQREQFDHIKGVLLKIEEAYPKRNKYVHGFYTGPGDDNSAHMFSVRVKGKVRMTDVLVTADEIYNAYLELLDARMLLAKVVRDLDDLEIFHDKNDDAADQRSGSRARHLGPTSPAPEPELATTVTKRSRPPRLSSAQKRAARQRDEATPDQQ